MNHVIPGIKRPLACSLLPPVATRPRRQQLECYRGLLVGDRSPASKLAEGDRRALAEVADAVFPAAVAGSVHLVQSGRAVRLQLPCHQPGRAATAGAAALPPGEQVLAETSPQPRRARHWPFRSLP